MKKLWILMALLLLAACGGGGGGGVTAGPAAEGVVTVNFNNGTTKKLVASLPPDPTFVRVVAQGTDPGNSTKKIVDAAIGSGAVTMTLPTGFYTISALYYVQDGPLNRMLRYGQITNHNIIANQSNSVTITIGDITASLTPSPSATATSPIFAGNPYNGKEPTPTVSAPLRAEWALFAQNTQFTTTVHLATASAASISHANDLVPVYDTTGNLFFQGEFYISDALISAAEKYTSWVFNAPNPLYDGYVAVSSPLTVNVTSSLAADVYPPRMASFTAPASANSTVLTGIFLSATDNVGVTGFLIKAVAHNAPAPSVGTVTPMVTNLAGQEVVGDPGWLNVGSYSIDLLNPTVSAVAASLVDGTQVDLYAWARDKAMNTSAVMSPTTAVTPVTVTYHTAPLITSVLAPTAAQTGNTYSPITIVAVGTPAISGYAFTESATTVPTTFTPFATTPKTATFAAPPTGHGAITRTLYAWVQDSAATPHTSAPFAFNVFFNDSPVINTFTAAKTGINTASLTLTATAVNGPLNYLVNNLGGLKPAATAAEWSATAPTTYTWTSTPAAGSLAYIYGWVKDANNVIVGKAVGVQF